MDTTKRERLIRVIEEAVAAECARADKEAADLAMREAQASAPSKLAALLPSSFFRPLAPAEAHPQLAPSARTVMMLRPRPGLLLDGTLTVDAAARKMQESNSSAALVVDAHGLLEGIITDSDVTRKVLAKRLDPSVVTVTEVMTRNPKSVTDEDNASHALLVMVEGKFRHLPVLGSGHAEGKLCGVLDVVKCLFDAISTIESSHLPGGQVRLDTLLAAAAAGQLQSGSPSNSPPCSDQVDDLVEAGDAAKEATDTAAAAAAATAAVAAAAAPAAAAPSTSRWAGLASTLFGARSSAADASSLASPTSSQRSPSPGGSRPSIMPTASVQKAAEQMAARKGAVLVSEARRAGQEYFSVGGVGSSGGGGLPTAGSTCAGVLTPKDVLYRVVARGLDPSQTQVSQVMTPSPDCILSSATILDALHQLQGAGYRQLPVLDSATGTHAGVVDVLTLIQGAMLLGAAPSGSGSSAAGMTAATAATTASAAFAPATADTLRAHPSEVDVTEGFEFTGRDDEATGPGSPFVCVDDPSSVSSRSSNELSEHPASPGLCGAKLPPSVFDSEDASALRELGGEGPSANSKSSRVLLLAGIAGSAAALLAVAAQKRH